MDEHNSPSPKNTRHLRRDPRILPAERRKTNQTPELRVLIRRSSSKVMSRKTSFVASGHVRTSFSAETVPVLLQHGEEGSRLQAAASLDMATPWCDHHGAASASGTVLSRRGPDCGPDRLRDAHCILKIATGVSEVSGYRERPYAPSVRDARPTRLILSVLAARDAAADRSLCHAGQKHLRRPCKRLRRCIW